LEEFQAREWGISWKIPGWEQIHEQVSIDLGRIRAGEGEYLGNLQAGRQIHQQIHKDPRRMPGWGEVISPTM
jgi:hypothetical protein